MFIAMANDTTRLMVKEKETAFGMPLSHAKYFGHLATQAKDASPLKGLFGVKCLPTV